MAENAPCLIMVHDFLKLAKINIFFFRNISLIFIIPAIVLIQVNRSKHSISETQVMEQRIFSFGIKEQLIVILQNVNEVEQIQQQI